jgi:type IV pilus assembly protein PilF
MTIRISLALVAMALAAACVTEGPRPPEPASDEEAAIANLNLGVGYLQQGRPDAAVDALERALSLNPRLVDAHSTIALAYDQIEEPEQAEVHHRRATQLDPSDPDAQNRYAVFLCRYNRWSDAEPYFERAIDSRRYANRQLAMLNAATCARSANEYETAEGYLRQVLDDNPGNVAALEGMVDLSIRSGNYLQGRAFLQRLFAATQPSATHLLYCYVVEDQLGDGGAADNCATDLRTRFPGSPEVRRLTELQGDGG